MDKIAPASLPAIQPQPVTVTPKDAATAVDFEAVFLGQMTKLMLESVEQGGEFSGGNGEEVFRGVLAEKLGVEIARRGGIGLAPAVLEQIVKLQEQAK